MFAWKRTCLALGIAGVIGSTALHGQLLAANRRATKGDQGGNARPFAANHSAPNMERIQKRLNDRYKALVPADGNPEIRGVAKTPAPPQVQAAKPTQPAVQHMVTATPSPAPAAIQPAPAPAKPQTPTTPARPVASVQSPIPAPLPPIELPDEKTPAPAPPAVSLTPVPLAKPVAPKASAASVPAASAPMEVVTRPLVPPQSAPTLKPPTIPTPTAAPARPPHTVKTEARPSIAPAPRRPLAVPAPKPEIAKKQEIPIAPASVGKRHASPLKLPEQNVATTTPAPTPVKAPAKTPVLSNPMPKKPIAPGATPPLAASPPRIPADAKLTKAPLAPPVEGKVKDKPDVASVTQSKPAATPVPTASSRVAPPKAPLPVPMKSIAAAPVPKGSGGDYASRIAAKYDEAVKDGQEREQASAMAVNDRPLAKRAELPVVKDRPTSPAVKPNVATVTAKPLVIGEKDKPAERASTTIPNVPAAAVARDTTPVPATNPGSTAIPAVTRADPAPAPASPAPPAPVGLSFVIERARQGSSLIDPIVPVASTPAPVVTSVPGAAASVPAPPTPPPSVAPPTSEASVASAAKAPTEPTLAKAKPVPDSVEAKSPLPEPPAAPAPARAEKREIKPNVVATKTSAKRTEPKSEAVSAVATKASTSRDVVSAGGPVLAGDATKVAASEQSSDTRPVPETVRMAKLEDKPLPPRAPAKKAAPKASENQPRKVKKSAPPAVPAASTAAPKAIEPHDAALAQRHLETLRKGGNDQERQKALAAIGQMSHWEDVNGIGPVIRNIAMTDYNTQLRLQAVRMLGQMTRERRMVVEALHISAEYDSDITIRSTSTRLLEQLAATPSDNIRR